MPREHKVHAAFVECAANDRSWGSVYRDEPDTWMVQPPVQPAFNTGPLREFVIVLPLIVTGPAAL